MDQGVGQEIGLAPVDAHDPVVVLPPGDQPLVIVYRPTTFVIWGGNRGGVQAAQRVQVWGQGWVSQVLEGSWAANPSFQGFSVQTGPATWGVVRTTMP